LFMASIPYSFITFPSFTKKPKFYIYRLGEIQIQLWLTQKRWEWIFSDIVSFPWSLQRSYEYELNGDQLSKHKTNALDIFSKKMILLASCGIKKEPHGNVCESFNYKLCFNTPHLFLCFLNRHSLDEWFKTRVMDKLNIFSIII